MKRSNNILPVIVRAAIQEFRSICSGYAALLLLVGGIFLYGILYNYMYAPNQVTGAPVAVVDLSKTPLSREYVRLLQATPQVEIYGEAVDYNEAREWMKEDKVVGILYLPYDFEERLFRGKEALFVMYSMTNAFLYYLSLQEATSYVMLALDDKYRTGGIVFLPVGGILGVATAQPVTVTGTVLYNYTEGYGSYLIPAVMIIILFQTLMMLIGILTGNEYTRNSLEPYLFYGINWRTALALVSGKTFIYFILYSIFALFLLGLLPHFYSIPNIGNLLYIIHLVISFLLSTSFLGLAASRYYTDSEAPLLMIAFFSVGLVFLSGVSYPLDLMTPYWKAVHYILPATTATMAYVQLNSMGADLQDIRPQYIALWVQTLVYFLLSVWVYKQKLVKSATRIP
ncbi:MAG: ABC transporter permease [Bacteroides sp.]|nr:ABC transporter permease [Bacteroides sp.]